MAHRVLLVHRGLWGKGVERMARRPKRATVGAAELSKVLLPVELHRKLKVAAAMQRRTLRSVLIEAASEWLKRQGRN